MRNAIRKAVRAFVRAVDRDLEVAALRARCSQLEGEVSFLKKHLREVIEEERQESARLWLRRPS